MTSSTDSPQRPLAEGPELSILLAAGGTGGHIYPAIALGKALAQADPSIRIHYCCGNRPGELEIYRAAGIEPRVLPISGRRRGLINHAKFAAEFFAALRAARGIVKEVKPRLAVGFGGYTSVPALLAARRSGAVTAIHEQNAKPGLANRFLARRARLILTGLEVPAGTFPAERTRFVGNPVRAELLQPLDAAESKQELGLPPDGRICLCFGGSQGARGVNRLILEMLRAVPGGSAESTQGGMSSTEPVPSDWHFLWATGPPNFEAIRREIEGNAALQRRVTLQPYLERMDLAYAAADLVISRAGAITLAEITALGKPSILIPLPTSAGGHQRSNAEALAAAGAAIVIDENDADAAGKIARSLEQFGGDCARLTRMSSAAYRLAKPNAAGDMVEAVRSLHLRAG